MSALVLEKTRDLRLREIEIVEPLGPHDVRIRIHTVGVCGSDVHYYQHGAIGPFVVRAPMVLGHEASGVIEEVGSAVTTLAPGNRVCMEPGIPDPNGRATRLGLYNLDPAVRFWATPPVHGCLRPSVVHPAAFTFKLPDNVGFDEGAMVEPLAVGMHAANKARIKPGDVAVVLGAGPIGVLTALAALAGGCSRVVVTDVQPPKLALAASLGPITPVDVRTENLDSAVRAATDGWGADIVFEATGRPEAVAQGLHALAPGGCLVLVGMPGAPVPFDVVAAQVKEARVETVFRYAHVYPRALALMASRKIDVRPLVTDRYAFADSIAAFDYACAMRPESVKVQISLA
ncbi:NAD(P)-dependent alcohol dehydrogenase [Opitutales bacterium ASA1]|uniref:NAD(P)-dependent alcohol dehydrogenase n=1 Tax=Congregicoccus parvus TaxID=3081749 RepID=UPI002B2CBEAA|nr:NAD(P)-dependent alcohol dehydrogenase [Opitutales bacterium ASA1]